MPTGLDIESVNKENVSPYRNRTCILETFSGLKREYKLYSSPKSPFLC